MQAVLEMMGPLMTKCIATGIVTGVLAVGLAEALCAVVNAFKRLMK